MELKVYRQSTKKRPDGTIVYKGEDALPFVGKQIFFVADGLGGGAAIYHQKLNPDLFEEDKLMDTLFKGVYEEYSDERFVKYVTDSFFELRAVKDCYTANIYNIKKSGYFASRIVAAVMLHALIYNDKPGVDFELSADRLFEQYNSREDKNAFLKELGDCFAAKIGEDIRKIAKNANLIYESQFTGLALLGTTLCATLYHETENAVEALYLTAGDSRPYVWTENDGLCQVTEDQEREDGGMTNYIKANEGATFDIKCSYMRFDKPCILFNASDGCFDSGYFLSQMAFEKLILDKAVSSNDTEDMGKKLEEVFLTYGRHDDSSTIAMKIFGYESFALFQESAERRLKRIDDDYISKLSDLLERDYVTEYKESSAKLPQQLSGIKAEFEAEFERKDAVKAFCVQRMRTDKYPPYETEISRLKQKINEAEKQKASASNKIEDIIARNYAGFASLQTHKESRGERHIHSIDEKHKEHSENYMNLIDTYRSEFETTVQHLKSIIDCIFEIGIPSDFSDYDDAFSIDIVEECEQSMNSLFEFFQLIKKKKQGAIRKLARLRKKHNEENRKLASANKEEFNNICEKVISGEIKLDSVQGLIPMDDYKELQQELAKIYDAEGLIKSLNTKERPKIFRKCLNDYWEGKYKEIIEAIISDPSVPVSGELKEKAKAIIEELKMQTGELKDKAELQLKLFKQYDASYGKYLGGTNE